MNAFYLLKKKKKKVIKSVKYFNRNLYPRWFDQIQILYRFILIFAFRAMNDECKQINEWYTDI